MPASSPKARPQPKAGKSLTEAKATHKSGVTDGATVPAAEHPSHKEEDEFLEWEEPQVQERKDPFMLTGYATTPGFPPLPETSEVLGVEDGCSLNLAAATTAGGPWQPDAADPVPSALRLANGMDLQAILASITSPRARIASVQKSQRLPPLDADARQRPTERRGPRPALGTDGDEAAAPFPQGRRTKIVLHPRRPGPPGQQRRRSQEPLEHIPHQPVLKPAVSGLPTPLVSPRLPWSSGNVIIAAAPLVAESGMPLVKGAAAVPLLWSPVRSPSRFLTDIDEVNNEALRLEISGLTPPAVSPSKQLLPLIGEPRRNLSARTARITPCSTRD